MVKVTFKNLIKDSDKLQTNQSIQDIYKCLNSLALCSLCMEKSCFMGLVRHGATTLLNEQLQGCTVCSLCTEKRSCLTGLVRHGATTLLNLQLQGCKVCSLCMEKRS